MTLKPLFEPANIAIVGASRTPGKQGHTAVVNAKKAGFAGGIFPINPAGGEVEGLTCYPSLAAAPSRVDCALLVVPATASLEAVRDCAAAGVRAVVIGATGFAELGTDEGRRRQDEVVALALAAGMRVMGPNTNGVFNASRRLSLGYNTSHGDPLDPGPVSIAAHSGALFNAVAPRLRELGVGLSKYAPVGNEADLTLLDFFEYFITDDDTRIIALIVESISDGARFRELARRARAAGKPVVALKLGRSQAGAGAAAAHSSRLAGNARAVDALLRGCGVGSVPSVEALAGACAVLKATSGQIKDPSLVVVATSGGGASLMADHAAAYGVKLAGEPDGSWGGKVGAAAAAFGGSIRNPADTGSMGGHDNIDRLFAVLEQEDVGGPVLLFAHNFPNPDASRRMVTRMAGRRQRTGAPVIVVSPGGLAADVVEAYRASGIPYFRDSGAAFASLRAFYETRTDIAPPPAGAKVALGDLERLLTAGRSLLSETESAAILRAAGVPMVESRVVSSAADAAQASLPAVMKALAPGVAHKAREGFVRVGLRDAAAVADAYAALEQRLAARGFQRKDAAIIVQPMRAARAELILGVSREGPLGHFLLAGLGGVYAEILDETVLLPIPSARATIRERLRESKIGALAGAALDQVVAALVALQDLALVHGDRIESIDINPLLLTDDGCVAVDALVVTR